LVPLAPFYFLFIIPFPLHHSISTTGCLFTNPFPQRVASSPLHFQGRCLFTIPFRQWVASEPTNFPQPVASSVFTIPFSQQVALPPHS
jgi:hypothetical protein